MRTCSIGTSGYVYEDWRGVFYPPAIPKRQWLSYYSERMHSVEINATFYGSFTFATFEKWKNQVGKDFLFTVKGTRCITHVKRLKDPEASLERFFSAASGLGEQLSCVLWQFPKNFMYKEETAERLENFLQLLPQDVRQSIEFRHTSWFTNRIFTLLDRYRVGFVINDSPHFPEYEQITGDFVYIRFHGPSTLYASKYSDEELEQWAKKIKSYLKRYDVYCYFNNDYFGYALENASQLSARVLT
jgi:uncharacterized protein YecE (DUF72 family)